MDGQNAMFAEEGEHKQTPPYAVIYWICGGILLYVLHSVWTTWRERRSVGKAVSRADLAQKREAHLSQVQQSCRPGPVSPEKKLDNYVTNSQKHGDDSHLVRKRRYIDNEDSRSSINSTSLEGLQKHNQLIKPVESNDIQTNMSEHSPKPKKSSEVKTSPNGKEGRLQAACSDKNTSALKYSNGHEPKGGGTSAPADEELVNQEAVQRDVEIPPHGTRPGPPEIGSSQWKDYMAEILKRALSTEVISFSSKKHISGSFQLRESDLPKTVKEVEAKCGVMYVRRLAGEFHISKLRFAISTWHCCLAEQQSPESDDIVQAMMQCFMDLTLTTIFAQLKEVEDEEEDDLFAASADQQENAYMLQTAGFLFIKMVGGWDDRGVSISPALLRAVLEMAAANPANADILLAQVRSIGKAIAKVHSTDIMSLYSYWQAMDGLETLVTQPIMIQLLMARLEHEVEEARQSLGVYFEKESTLGSLLNVTTIPPSLEEGIDSKSPEAQPWIELPNFPQVKGGDLADVEAIYRKRSRKMIDIVTRCLTSLAKANRATTIKWISLVVSLNESRTHVVEQVRRKTGSVDSLQVTCNDGFMVNFCAVLLKLCLPFCGKPEKLAKIELAYPTSMSCHLNYDFETCLAGGMIVRDSSAEADNDPSALEQEGEDKEGCTPATSSPDTPPDRGSDLLTYNFMTEIFHITLRAMNIGYFPAITHYEKLLRVLDQMLKLQPGTKEANSNPKKMLFAFRWQCSMFERELMEHGSFLYLSLAQWLTAHLKNIIQVHGKLSETAMKEQSHLLANLPEFVVKDMSTWFYAMAVYGSYNPVSGLLFDNLVIKNSIHDFVDCCISLLQRQDLMPGPVPAWKITRTFHAFVRSTRNARYRKVDLNLAACILAAPNTEQHLGPALVHHYVSVSVVEGIDVDKEAFDKYHARSDIGEMIQILWEQLRHRESILQLCGTAAFQEFLGTILDTLLYMLHDSLSRISEVKKLEAAKKDAHTWDQLSRQEQAQKEQFIKSQIKVAKGFMNQAQLTMGLLDLLSKSEVVARCFTQQPLARRAATVLIGFLEGLCGSKATSFQDFKEFSTDPYMLLQRLVSVVLRIVEQDSPRQPEFLASFATDADYSEPTMRNVSCVLMEDESCTALQPQMDDLIEQLIKLQTAAADQLRSTGGGQSTTNGTQWRDEIEAVVIDEEELERCYCETMRPLQYDEDDLQDSHSIKTNAAQAANVNRRKVQALQREMQSWQTDLPCHPHAAAFIRQDEECMDRIRALVTGRPGTPYSLGCFLFDIYIPNSYPHDPPIVNFITTGGRTVRFNPNLYEDGKVCLSLIRTFNSSDPSQTWQAGSSTLLQVLVSLQTLILNEEPRYNEPGYEAERNTPSGNALSEAYNRERHLMTVRYAMVENLRNPPQGFAEVIHEHFRVQRWAVLKQCCDWLKLCEDSDEKRKLQQAVDKLREELEKLDGSSDDGGKEEE